MKEASANLVMSCLKPRERGLVTATSAGVRKLVWCLETLRANAGRTRAAKPRRRGTPDEDEAQRAVDKLRKLVPKIAKAYRNAPDRYEDHREEFEAFATKIEGWINDAPDFVLKDRPDVSQDWQHIAVWARDFYDLEIGGNHHCAFASSLIKTLGIAVQYDAVRKHLQRRDS